MKKTDGKFSQICHKVAAEYPEITADEWYIDIMTANLVNEKIRSDFEVFLLPNLYGDIITDEAAEFQGGVGTAGSANIGKQTASNMKYIYDPNGNGIVIYGSGEMKDFSENDSPFTEVTFIETIGIEEGVTSLGSNLFTRCTEIQELIIPNKTYIIL